jgi:uncharacterized protein YukE
MAKQDLTVNVQAKGAKKTAQDLKSVESAQKDLTKGTEGQTKVADKATEAQEGLNSNTEAYAAILANVSPRLGQFAAAGIHARKIVEGLGSSATSLTKHFGRLRAAVLRNARALKLLGAGGALAFGLWAIVAAVRAMGKAFDDATEAAKKLLDELRRQKEEFAEQAKAVRAVADARRQFAALTPQEVERATKRRRGMVAQYGVSPGAATAVAGGTAGLGLDLETQARFGLAMDLGLAGGGLDPRMSERQREQYIAGVNRQNQEKVASRIRAERMYQKQQREAARQESRQVGGTTANLRAELRIQFPGRSEEDVAQIAQRIQQQGGDLDTFRAARRGAWQWNPWRGWEGTRKIRTIEGRPEKMTAVEQVELERAIEGLQSGGGETIGGPLPGIRSSSLGPMPRLNLPSDDPVLDALTRDLGGTVEPRGGVNIGQYIDNSQNTYPDLSSQEAARSNGETTGAGAF